MDIFQRAVDIFDRAQGRMTYAGNQAARLVVSAAQMRALEARLADLRTRLEQATMDLGKLTFQRWKSGGVGNEQALTALCQHIDVLNAEYQQALNDLAHARAGMVPPSYPGYPVSPPAATPPGPNGQYAPGAGYPPALPPPSAPPYAQPPPGPYYSQFPPYHAQPAPAPQTSVPPSQPPRLDKPARECPECYTMVPGSTDFCPSCGMRV